MNLFESQVSLYQQLSDLADLQGPAVEKGESDTLLSLLAQRQTLVDELTSLSAELSAYIGDWDRWLIRMVPSQRQRLSTAKGRIESLRVKISEQDQRDCDRIAAGRDKVSQDLRQLNQVANAARTYAPARQAAGTYTRYMDQKG